MPWQYGEPGVGREAGHAAQLGGEVEPAEVQVRWVACWQIRCKLAYSKLDEGYCINKAPNVLSNPTIITVPEVTRLPLFYKQNEDLQFSALCGPCLEADSGLLTS
jgi:hypothetical protein